METTIHFCWLIHAVTCVCGCILQTSWRWTASTSAWQSCPPPRSPCATAQAFPVATRTTTQHTAPSSTSRSWPPSSKNHHNQHLLPLYCHKYKLKSSHDEAVDYSSHWSSCRWSRYIFIIKYITKQIMLHNNSRYIDLNQATLELFYEKKKRSQY